MKIYCLITGLFFKLRQRIELCLAFGLFFTSIVDWEMAFSVPLDSKIFPGGGGGGSFLLSFGARFCHIYPALGRLEAEHSVSLEYRLASTGRHIPGEGLPYITDGDACRNFQEKPLKVPAIFYSLI